MITKNGNVDYEGKQISNFTLPKTITGTGTTGAQTINKLSGSVNFAIAASSLVVTNSLVTVNSVIIATIMTNDLTMQSVSATPSNGSFILNTQTPPTAETKVGFLVIN